MIILDVMYGVIFSANRDMFSKDPPVNALKKLNESESPVICENHSAKKSLFIPGTGS